MKLLEIVRGRETSKRGDRDVAEAGASGSSKVGVVVGNCFGFVANRMLAYYMREAYLLLEEGASVPQIDRALTDFGMPVGPFGMQDIAGIDVGARIRQYLQVDRQDPRRRAAVGGAGSAVRDGPVRTEDRRRLVPLRAWQPDAHSRSARRRDRGRGSGARAASRGGAVADDEIIARITTALANEGARVLEEGYAIRASDIDVIYCYGFGFPRHRGGPMFYADTVGLPTVLARVKEYREQFGDYWRPAPLLERLVAEGRGFYTDAA